jgi:hypothetical protein
MSKRRTELARRPKPAATLRAKFQFTAADPLPQYVIDQTLLGEFALHWTAEWLAGLFCVSDFPAEWVALVRASIRGGWREGAFAGGAAAFSTAVWDVKQWDATLDDAEAARIFSEVLLQAAAVEGPMADVIDAVLNADVTLPQDLKARIRKRLPPKGQRALPDRKSSTL